MATDGTYKIASLPEGTDLVSRASYVGELEKMDAGLAHMLALQTNASTTAYETDAPFSAYYDGMTFQFVPAVANTGAATLDVNGIGAKKLCDSGGTQISAAGALAARQIYWLEYDSTLDSGNGAFAVYVQYVDLTSAQTIAGAKTFSDPIVAADTVSPISGTKFMITPEGGFAVKLTNKTGGASVKGRLAAVHTSVASALRYCPHDSISAVGFFYEDGVADGSETWVVTAGIAPCQMYSGESSVMSQHCLVHDTQDGYARSVSSLGSTDMMIGRHLVSSAAGGMSSVLMTMAGGT